MLLELLLLSRMVVDSPTWNAVTFTSRVLSAVTRECLCYECPWAGIWGCFQVCIINTCSYEEHSGA